MKNGILNIYLFFLLLTSCVKNIQTRDLIYAVTFQSKQMLADGTSTDSITVEINPNADASKRNVIFTSSEGNFVGGANGTISITAGFVSQKLIAVAKLKAPYHPGNAMIMIKIDLPNEQRNFTKTDSVSFLISIPAKISIKASSFGAPINFTGEDTISGIVTNSMGNPVSNGVKVALQDFYATDHSPVGGQFRAAQLTTSDGSFSAIYSPGFVTAGKQFWIKGNVLDSAGAAPSIADSVLLFTIPNQ